MFTGNILYQPLGSPLCSTFCGIENLSGLGQQILNREQVVWSHSSCILPALRLIFWLLRWETGIEMLLHHIG